MKVFDKVPNTTVATIDEAPKKKKKEMEKEKNNNSSRNEINTPKFKGIKKYHYICPIYPGYWKCAKKYTDNPYDFDFKYVY